MKKKKPLSHEAYLKKVNAQIRKHPHYQEGMQVNKIGGGLYDMTMPGVDATNPDDFNTLKEDVDLQRVLWDSLAVVDRTYSYTEERVREKRLPESRWYRMSKEGRCSVMLESMLHSLYQDIMTYKQGHAAWPVEVTSLIEKLRMRDPWDKSTFPNVHYTAPRDDADPEQVLAEYTREGKRKFVLYVNGHQETWEI